MTYKTRSTLTTKGQVTLPAELRRRWGLQAGDCVDFCLEDDGRVVLRKWLRRSVLEGREHLPPLSPGAQATLDLLRSWREADDTTDPEAIRQAEEELAEFKQAMNAPRSATGARLLYP